MSKYLNVSLFRQPGLAILPPFLKTHSAPQSAYAQRSEKRRIYSALLLAFFPFAFRR